jgi:hypothetical protein
MKFVCYADWEQLPESANGLLNSAARESVFFSRPWFENLASYRADSDLPTLLACVIEGDELLALLPLSQRGEGHYQSLKHLYTSLSTLLIAEQNREAVLRCLVEGLRTLPVHSLEIDPISEGDTNLLSLQRTLEASGFDCQRYFRFRNWIHRTHGESFSDYMAARPSRVRNTIARKKRKLEREHAYHIQLFTGGDLRQALEDYSRVYAASWKPNEVFQDFVNGLATHLSGPGWLRLAILYIGDQPAAAQFWFVVHGKASIFKLVYDQKWKQYSPGSILIAYLMEHVIDHDQVEEIDFLTGNDAYKQDWMSERRQRWRLSCINQHPPELRDTKPANPINTLLKWLKEKVYNRAFRTD